MKRIDEIEVGSTVIWAKRLYKILEIHDIGAGIGLYIENIENGERDSVWAIEVEIA